MNGSKLPNLNWKNTATAPLMLLSTVAHAQTASEEPATISAASGEAASPLNPYQRFDDLALKGWDVPFPRTGDTILRDKGGVRDALAELGIGFLGLSASSGAYNLLDNARPSSPKTYNGQRPTVTVSSTSLTATFDASRIGLNGGQFIASGNVILNGFQRVNGPRDVRVESLAYFQSVLNGKVEFKVGYIDNAQEFIGTSVGGNIATGTLGPQAVIPYQVGMSYLGGTPALNVRVRFNDTLYIKSGIQRSFPPAGFRAEKAANDFGLKFAPKGTGVLLINEVGYNRPASAGVKQIWLRAGGLYNTTDYPDFRTGLQTRDNGAVFAAADRQLTQPRQDMPFRGLYGGVSVNFAPPAQNLYTEYYEGRLYAIGIIATRPLDLASLVVSYRAFGEPARLALTPPGQHPYSQTVSAIASYAYRVTSGIYLQPGLGVLVHPTFAPRYATALNAYLGLTFLF